jgi:hypothetical protein
MLERLLNHPVVWVPLAVFFWTWILWGEDRIARARAK